MPTIINNPSGTSEGGNGLGMVVGVLLAIVILALFFIYALPSLRTRNNSTNINVPDRIDVNVNRQPNY
jgi:hypothetical protein